MGSSEVLAQALRMVRGIIVARALGPDMMGIAFSMLILIDFIERLVFINPGVTLVQDPKGGARKYRHSLQFVLLVRGVFFAAIAVILAWPMAWLSSLNEPQYIVGFFAVALLPIVRGFVHVDIFRQLRNRRYTPTAIVTVIPPFVSLVVAIPLCMVIKSFWLPIILLMINGIVIAVTSAFVAKRKYGLLLDRAHLTRIAKFIIPLAAAGIIIFFTIQGPRILLQSAPRVFHEAQYTMTDVGLFGIALTLCLLPESVASRVVATTWEPQLARLRENGEAFRRVFIEMQSISYMFAAATMVVFGIGSTWVLVLYDNSYAAAGPIVTVLSVLAGLRLGRSAMRSAALATGRSSIILYANLAGLIGLVAAVVAVIQNRSVPEIASCLILGELASFVVGNIPLMRGPLALRFNDLWVRPIIFSAIGIAGAYAQRAFLPNMPLILTAISSIVFALLVVVGTAIVNPVVRKFLLELKGKQAVG